MKFENLLWACQQVLFAQGIDETRLSWNLPPASGQNQSKKLSNPWCTSKQGGIKGICGQSLPASTKHNQRIFEINGNDLTKILPLQLRELQPQRLYVILNCDSLLNGMLDHLVISCPWLDICIVWNNGRTSFIVLLLRPKNIFCNLNAKKCRQDFK